MGGGGGAEQNTGVANREGVRLDYLQLRMDTETLKALGQAPVASSGERGGLGSAVPGLGGSDAFWSSLVDVCLSREAGEDGGAQGRGDPGTAGDMFMYFAVLGVLCRKEQGTLEGEGKCVCEVFLSSSAKQFPGEQ